MKCSACDIPMSVENEIKENGFCFVWYRCPKCNEAYLSKSPLAAHLPTREMNSDPIRN